MPLLKKISLLLTLCAIFLVPGIVSAQYGLNETAGASGLTERYPSDVPTLIGNVIGTALSMIAVIFFVLMVYGGFLWMTAHGDSGQVDKAKDTIVAAIIGIIVVLASYAITNFVFSATKGSGGAASGGSPAAAAPVADPNAECKATGVGYDCRDESLCGDELIGNICPGGANIVCCVAKP